MSPRPKLRILQVLRAPVGGLFRHVNDLTRSLAERGHDIAIVADSIVSDGLTEKRLAALAPFASLGIHRFPIPRVLGPGDFTSPVKIKELADRLKIQVVHGHGAKGGFAARYARMRRHGRVSLYTPHGGILNYKANSPTGKVFRAIERILLPSTDAIVFESGFAKAAFERLIATPRCAAPVIHNGLAPAEFDPVQPGPGAADFVFIGEFRSVKGIDYLLNAIGPIAAPDGRPATLVMAGSGPDLEKTRALIAQLGLAERVTLAGVQPAREMFERGNCVVVPSLAESLPYVILEAASAAHPVIATNVGGVAEIFGPTKSSLIAAADALALRSAMQRFLDDPDTAAAEMQVRLDFIKSGFSLAHMTDQIEALYHDLLARR